MILALVVNSFNKSGSRHLFRWEPLRKVQTMCPESVYTLADGVQVRREKFGLLFYDYRGPRLYFLPSGDLMDDRFFDGERTVRGLVESLCAERDWPQPLTQGRVDKILELLKMKGLIHEQSVC